MSTSTTIDHAGIEWDVRNNLPWTPYLREYCADGDGVVRVSHRAVGCFKGFLVFDQRDYMGKHNTLEEALDHAAALLAQNYPAIYAEFHFDEE